MTAPDDPRSPIDHGAALAQYRRRAAVYDLELALFEPIRRTAIARLALRSGDTVLDVGCGTGLSLAPLEQAVGAGGRIVGIEQCPEMIERARGCVQRHGWHNVALLEASAERAEIRRGADAALFHFTHDILRDPLALDNVTHSLRPGAGVVACGLQWAHAWAWPLNLFVLGAALHSVSSLDGLDRPWRELADRVDDLRVEPLLGGSVFLASGTVRSRAARRSPRPETSNRRPPR